MDKLMKYICWSLILIGIVIGPFYMVYGWYFSGSEVAYIKQVKSKEMQVTLNPSMNPILLKVQGYLSPDHRFVESRGDLGNKTNEYLVDLEGSNRTINKSVSLHFDASGRKGSTNWKTQIKEWIFLKLGLTNKGWKTGISNPIRLSQKETFTINVGINPSQNELDFEKLNLEIRSNVIIPDPKIYVSGFVMILMGIILANIYFNDKNSEEKVTSNESEDESE